MFTSHNYYGFIVLAILLGLTNLCSCMHSDAVNVTSDGFSQAVATWYGDAYGPGSGGACGYADAVANAPYYGMISAGSKNIYKSGAGCGTCYQVKCTENPACSGNPITVTITDECPGCAEAYHFDLSGKAFGYLAKNGQGDALRNAGKINIQYSRQFLKILSYPFGVHCHYNSNIALKIDSGSNRYYLAFVVENMNGAAEIGHIEVLTSSRGSLSMQRNWGETWKVNIPDGVPGPFSVRITDIESRSVLLQGVIPANWAPGKIYYSNVNFP